MNPTPSPPITLMAVGDVLLDRPNPTEAFSLVAHVLRDAYDLYIPYERHEWNPGLLPQVVSALDDEDADRVQSDIAEAKTVADIVVVSAHWGDFSRPFVLTDHERQCARLFIDSGADVVLGHHHHLLRGVEWYEGRPIFYGLGHFVFDQPHLAMQLAAEGAPD